MARLTVAQIQARALELANQPYESPLNNLNYKKASDSLSSQALDGSSSQENLNLNNLKRGGVPRLELYKDPALKKAMEWEVEEWLVQICIRDYGLATVKAQIARIFGIPDGYFKPKYGPLNAQRGRIFNKEMQKLRGRSQ